MHISTYKPDDMLWLSTWWRHQMETFSVLLAICAGNSPDPVWINDWVNNRDAGDLRRYHAHYDVIVMNMQKPVTYSRNENILI